MSKLIVEENGERRVFKLSRGILTIGSGAEARLRLASLDVAEIHLELELSETGILVRPRPGVTPAQVSGVAISHEKSLGFGRVIQIGSARVWVEAEGVPAGSGPDVGRPGKRVLKPKTAPVSRSVVKRGRPRVEHGAPVWLITGGIITAVAVGLIVLKVMFDKSVTHEVAGLTATIAAIRNHIQLSQLDVAEEKVVWAMERASATERRALEALQGEIDASKRRSHLVVAHHTGSKWMKTYLENYEDRYLAGEPESYKIRLFVKRLYEFKRRWPEHPRIGWVERELRRLEGTVDLVSAPTWEDVEWEVRFLVAGKPRSYASAFALLEEILPRLESDEEIVALRMRKEELVPERAEYHKDRLRQAEYEYKENEDPAMAVWWLVNSILELGDPGMADEAAEILVKFPNAAGLLLGYQESYPDMFEGLLKNDVVKAWAEKAGFSP